jgi:hypothetical protein
VHNVDEDPADLKHFGFLHRLGPRPFVVVATDGGNGSEGRELFQNGGMPNVTRVNDEIASAQERHCFRPQKTVSVRDKPYARHTWRPQLMLDCETRPRIRQLSTSPDM